jgi:protein-S-isoprenylcysteine O-methyltransferase Ste14
METGPPEKRLKVAPFAIHATRGLIRDQKARRKMMAISIAVAVILALAGLTVLRPWLDPHEHPWRFILFWLACAWEVVLAVLLAVLDLLLMRAQERAARKALRERMTGEAGPGPEKN